uniref:Uncharacterized protein n=1 Tax=Siphoviridae sp. ctZro7 TaxID=2825561 RepID=A0A8S5PQJ6_9CAUD|nr:MAG TPA: hypothetical protein [Siphoviridae sp. ctZro7]
MFRISDYLHVILTKKRLPVMVAAFLLPLVLLCKDPDSSRVAHVLRKLLPRHKLERLVKHISNKLVIKRRKHPNRRQHLSFCHLHYHTQPKFKSRLVLHNLNKLLNHIISLIKVNNKSQQLLRKAQKGPVRLSLPVPPFKYSPRFTFFPTKLPSFCFFLCQSSQSLSISSAVCFLLPSAFLASSFGYTTRGWSATISPI